MGETQQYRGQRAMASAQPFCPLAVHRVILQELWIPAVAGDFPSSQGGALGSAAPVLTREQWRMIPEQTG